MAEREIVPIADELAADALAGRAERYKLFIAQWDIENMPACDRGMILLMDLAENHPIAYEMARKQGFGISRIRSFRSFAGGPCSPNTITPLSIATSSIRD